MLVYTAKGLIERDQLTVKDVVTEDENSRAIATEWYLGDELIRRDVAVSLFRGLNMGTDQAEFR